MAGVGSTPVRGVLVIAVGLCLTAAGGATGAVAEAAVAARSSVLAWRDCGEGFQCSTAHVPLDYRRPGGRRIKLAVIRMRAQDRARRIGSLFVNFGGPGASGVDIVRTRQRPDLALMNERFDLVSWDPRGVGASAGAVDCAVDQRTEGIYGQPFARPSRTSEYALLRRVRRYVRRCVTRHPRPGLFPYIHTANTARDLDWLRAAVGDRKLSYLGFSYGTQIGATYATLFPRRVRALALDGAVDVEGFVNDPLGDFHRQSRAFEAGLNRFLAACGRRLDRCGFAASDPRTGYEQLLARLDRQPLAAPGAAAVDGDDLRVATLASLTRKQLWWILATALIQLQAGDGSLIRIINEVYYGLGQDPFVGIYALDGRWPAKPAPYLRAGRNAYRRFEHFWWTTGYGALALGLWPVAPRDAYYGPVDNWRHATPAVVVGTTHDTSTPYVWAKRLTADLGNARLLTMRGDGHTASFGGNSGCIDLAVRGYLEQHVVPTRGTVCRQEVPFAAPAAAAGAKRAKAILWPHAKSVLTGPKALSELSGAAVSGRPGQWRARPF